MPIAEQWATCYTNKRLNFGHRTTSPVEVVNRYLKSFIITGNSTVLNAVKQSFNMIDQMKEGIHEARMHQIYHIKREYIGQKWLGDAPLEISDKGMKKITKQYWIMLGAVPTARNPTPAPLNACTGQFTAQYGMPCSHQLFDRYMDGRIRLERGQEGKLVLNKLDFHPYWWLERSLLDEDKYLRYHEFDRVTGLRGRPRGSTAFAPDPRAPRSTAPLSTAQTPTPTLSTGRASGLQPSIRRQPSQWEDISLEAEDHQDQHQENAPAPRQRTVNNITVTTETQPGARGGRGGRGGRVARGSSTPRASSRASRTQALARRLQRPPRAGPEGVLPSVPAAVQEPVDLRRLWRLRSMPKEVIVMTAMSRQGAFLLHFWPCYVSNNNYGRFAFYCRIERFGLCLCLRLSNANSVNCGVNCGVIVV